MNENPHDENEVNAFAWYWAYDIYNAVLFVYNYFHIRRNSLPFLTPRVTNIGGIS